MHVKLTWLDNHNMLNIQSKEKTKESMHASYSTCMSLYMDYQNLYGIVTSGHLGIVPYCLNVDMSFMFPCLNWILLSLLISTKICVSVHNFNYDI